MTLDLDSIKASYARAQEQMPTYIGAAKRIHVEHGFMDDWWVGYGKDSSCQIEGTPNHWRWLAMILLGLTDHREAPYDEDKPTPEVVPELITEVERLRGVLYQIAHYFPADGDAVQALAVTAHMAATALEEAD